MPAAAPWPRLAIVSRILLAIAFIPTGLTKLLGQRYITVVTWSIGFRGTVYVTALMLLASLFLLCWDYDRLRSIVFEPPGRTGVASAPLPPVERAGYLVGAGAGLVLFLGARGLVPGPWLRPALAVGSVAAVLVGSGG